MSSFSVEHRHDPGTRTLTIHIDGEFKGSNVFDFENELLAEIRVGKAKTVVFDLARATYVDSAAIEFLFNCAKVCKESGQTLRLAHPRENIRKLFGILRVEKIIPIDP